MVGITASRVGTVIPLCGDEERGPDHGRINFSSSQHGIAVGVDRMWLAVKTTLFADDVVLSIWWLDQQLPLQQHSAANPTDRG